MRTEWLQVTWSEHKDSSATLNESEGPAIDGSVPDEGLGCFEMAGCGADDDCLK